MRERTDWSTTRKSKSEAWNISYSAYAEDWSAICAENPYIEKLIEMEEERERLEALLSKLTENQAKVMRHKYLYEENQKEIAEKLGITPQAVSDIVRKAMRRLKKLTTYKE